MADLNHLVEITYADFNKLKEDIRLLEQAYFSAPFINCAKSAKIDYKEAIRLIHVARNLNKINIKLNRLFDSLRSFVQSGDGISFSSDFICVADGATAGVAVGGSAGAAGGGIASATGSSIDSFGGGGGGFGGGSVSLVHSNGDCDISSVGGGNNGDPDSLGSGNNSDPDSLGDGNSGGSGGNSGGSGGAGSANGGLSVTDGGIDNNAGDIDRLYNDFIFGLRREMPLSMSPNVDLHAKSTNINISKDLFKKIIIEILDYEKHYNQRMFTSGGLYDVLKVDVVSKGRDALLPYVISNVLTYLKDSNFIGYYGKDGQNSFSVLDRDGLKLWADSIL
ncbi:MAG: hypothetical protein FWH55_09610 [Oscillospiraceae bacterium]|nr:hypothetical protein [Oscillospiraceae bacterium]